MWEFIFKVINFLLLVFLLFWFLKKPIKTKLKERHEFLRRAFEEAQQEKAFWEKQLEELKSKVKGLEEEAKLIRERIMAEAQREKERILEEAKKEAERIRLEAQKAMEEERRKLETLFREKLVLRTLTLAEKILKEHLTQKDQRKLLEDFVQNLRRIRC
jgi:F-type H+-transporting ATPase subunit b